MANYGQARETVSTCQLHVEYAIFTGRTTPLT